MANRPPAPVRLLALIAPGLLIAATGVGAGDLSTGAIAGSMLGVAILWAVVLGAFIKFVLTEGLTRWQIATNTTLLEGAVKHLGKPASIVFLLYFLPWSFFTGAALMSACGVVADAALPFIDDPVRAKLVYGAAHSAIAVLIVLLGGFRGFERLMGACVAIMFIAVIVTAIQSQPHWGEVIRGIALPRIPRMNEGGLTWTIALMGGVGGTLTILCYGYWIREVGREGDTGLRAARIDLAVGYVVTALFGMAMVIITRDIEMTERGAQLITSLADRIESRQGVAGRWIFIAGAWAAVFSSLLGVWQAVPYLFADFVQIVRGGALMDAPRLRRTWTYRVYLLLLAIVPLVQMQFPFKQVQKYYAVVGAGFIPILAVVLLIMNSRRSWIGEAHRNRAWTILLLVIVLALALVAAGYDVLK